MKNKEQLKDKILSLGIKRLIMACPNCFYELKKALINQEIEIITVYDVLKEQESPELRSIANGMTCTVHDSCPDRFEGTLGTQVREALQGRGYQIVEMEDSRDKTICCGSGGQISHFRPEFAQELVQKRISEAEKTGAETLVAYCLSCVLNFSRNVTKI
jgi:Fe-S oxidoreductase